MDMSDKSEGDTKVEHVRHEVISTEPAMYLQRPTSERSQDISHIFSTTFRELYCKDAVSQETVKNLAQSRSGGPSYHEHYAERLQQIQVQWEKDIELIERVEAHILKAKEAAREKEAEKTKAATDECPGYEDLGLPPVSSELGSCLDAELLKTLNLVVPEDFIKDGSYNTICQKSQENPTPQYAKPTTSSVQRHRKMPPEDNYHFVADGTSPPSRFLESGNTAEILEINRNKTGRKSKMQKHIHGVETNTRLKGERKVWKSSMKPQQRQVEREDLSRLQERAEFLKNPRFAPLQFPEKIRKADYTTVGKDKSISESPVNTTQAFVPIPCPVVFTDYEPGKAYEVVLRLKNVTSASRQLRVLPPSSSFFSIGLGQFPSENGVIAPGMSCHFTIYFSPDSLANFDDAVQVITTGCDTFTIPLQARRLAPQLSLPQTFDCGSTLVNTTKVLQLECHNTGGPGRFCILANDNWPTTTWNNSLDSPGSLTLNGFTFEPTMCQLNTGDKVNFKVTFSPTTLKTYKETIVFVCDNCDVKRYTIQGVGELAGVEFISVDGGVSEYDLGEFRDNTSQYFVRFSSQYPECVDKKVLKIKNTTSVPLPYKWVISKPTLGKKRNGNSEIKTARLAHDSRSAFSVEPCEGELRPNDISTFDVIFKSSMIGSSHSILTLVLENIPNNDKSKLGDVSDLPTLSIELKGESLPFQVLISPPALVVPGNCIIDTDFKYTIIMANSSDADAEFCWPHYENNNCLVTFSPQNGFIGKREKIEVDMFITGKKPIQIKEIIPCHVPFAKETVYIYLDMAFSGPDLEIEPQALDFGLIRYGEQQSSQIVLHNRSNISAEWCIVKASYGPYSDFDDMILIHQSCGILEPMSYQDIDISIKGIHPVTLKSYFELKVKNGNSKYFEMYANIQRPIACFLDSTLHIRECYVNIPVIKTIKFCNQTLLSTSFKFNKVIGADSETATATFYPEEGTLKPREYLNIEVTFVAKYQGEIKDFIALFDVVGTMEPVPLRIDVNTRGLSVEYIIPDNKGDIRFSSYEQATLDFGQFVNVGGNPERHLIVKNLSAIPAVFNVSVEYFFADIAIATHAVKNGNAKRSGNKRLLLSKQENSFSTRGGSETLIKAAAKEYLSKGKGACFVLTPANGMLEPFGQQVVTITAYSDMWGDYNDFLLCQAGNLPMQRIPIHMNVVGSPLNVQMSKEQPSIVRFGTCLSGTDVVKRKLCINNISPYDIRANWKPYILDFNDTQIIDLIVYIGKEFPSIEDHGYENGVSEECSPLITVHLAEHQGKEMERHFDVFPRQMIIPARGHAIAEAHFHPQDGIRASTDFIGYALGYMCLKNKDKVIENKCIRLDGENTLPFSINMTGTVKPARVLLETDDENGFIFNIPVSNLLKKTEDSYQVISSWMVSHRIVMINSAGTKLKVSITTQSPFQISFCSKSQKVGSGEGSEENQLLLFADQNQEVNVQFTLTPKLVEEMSDVLLRNKQEAQTEITDRTVELKRNLTLGFSNGDSQAHILTARLVWPCPKLSTDVVDFDICLVGQLQEHRISLTNYGGAAYYWIVKKDPSYPVASQAAFHVSPSHGYLQPFSGGSEGRNKQALLITFNPRQNVAYESRILFLGQLYEPIIVLHLQGTGSFDQAHENTVT